MDPGLDRRARAGTALSAGRVLPSRQSPGSLQTAVGIIEHPEAGLNGFRSVMAALGNARQERTAAVPTIQQQVAEKFLAKLAESGTLEPERIEQFRVLLSSGKKVKAEELVKLFLAPAGGDIK